MQKCFVPAIFLFVLLAFCSSSLTAQSNNYRCTPCGYECDKQVFNAPGTCPHCNMALVKASSIKFKTIQPAALCDYVSKHPGVVLLDVRTKEEFEGKADPNFGTLKNAINIPVQELSGRLSDWLV